MIEPHLFVVDFGAFSSARRVAAAAAPAAVQETKVDVSSIDFRGTVYASVVLDASLFPHEAVAKAIEYADLCTDFALTKGEPLKKDAHVTIKLGLDPKLATEEALRKALADTKPFVLGIGCRLGKFSGKPVFEDGKAHPWDVLWASVDDTRHSLCNIRTLLAPFALKDKCDARPEGYHPHVTLAFLEYGTADKYINNNEALTAAMVDAQITVKSLTFKVLGDKTVKPFEIALC